ncbi:MAG: YggT family protein [Snodgrassella sp.]|uniref:YggT family protein n=1 Tax=Snodgrassella TaxID=1193515 RepID=UPI000461B7B0|nr:MULTISPECIES: YggT family protein [Snodgrassella]KDN12261.1 Integral membrane protein YggT, involved in response to extracytoplasmic stress (osmotic shock) [Snodgrassella communis]MCO6507826.1 YggT family protein [Snodgrassella sp.]MCO6513539.1 YggT family protein [Snodgrassella sp.]MCO6515192.1 YggT family protein [Snodgrassella sp.]MCO6517968.1 YggT family protein [Snodgrassella sp.]
MISKTLFLLASALAIICWARVLLQWGKLPFLHPLAQFCVRSTNWLIRPLRRIIPPLGQWDVACILATIIIYYLTTVLNLFIAFTWIQPDARVISASLLFCILFSLKALCYALFIGLVIQMFLSLSKPYSVLLLTLQRIYKPLTRPFAFLQVGKYDFSATVILLVLWLCLQWWLPQLSSKISYWLISG